MVGEFPDSERLVREVESLRRRVGELEGELQGVTRTLAETEARLRECQDDSRILMETIPQMVSRHRPDSTYVYVSPACTRLFGYSPEELVGRRAYDFIHPEDMPTVMAASQRALETGGSEVGEYRHLTKDGAYVWVETMGRVIFGEKGSGPRDIICVVRDITERKRAEEALLNHENEYRALVERSLQGIAVLDDTGVTFANQAFAEISGYSIEELYALSAEQVRACVHPEDRQRVWSIVQKRLAGKLVPPRQEFRLVRKDGTVRWVESAASRIFYRDKPSLQIIHIDITERKRSEEARAAIEEQLRYARRMESVGQLAGGVAHDFNNILQSMMVRIGFLMDGLPREDPRYEDVGGIRHGIERAATLVKQLLAFGRRQVLDLKEIDFNALIGDFLKMTSRVIGEDIELTFVSGEGAGFVRADPSQMEQVLMNLCVNARDAMPEGGTIAIETQPVFLDAASCEAHPGAEPGPYVRLTLADTGAGMDEQTLGRIFDPFFTTKEVGKGTGLGLATVYGIVVQHQGIVEVTSELGKGTRFCIHLPRVERGSSLVEKKAHPEPKGGKETILLAEDDEALRQMTTRILTSAGYHVIAAANGEEAIALFDKHKESISLALLDVVMPRRGGRQVHDHIETVSPGTRVLFASGYSDDGIHTRFVLEKGMAFIQKPYKPKALLARIREMLDS